MSARPRERWAEASPTRVEERLVIERDGTVVVRSGKVEYGQGIRTGFARIVAEELDVPIARVRVELGETDRAPWDMGTFGSMSTAIDGAQLRAAAAYARFLLLKRASARFGCPSSDLATGEGRVRARDGREITYEALTDGQPLAGDVPQATASGPATIPPEDVPLRLEAHDIFTGRARFVADVRLPGMLRGHVLHPPRHGSRLTALDDRRARSVPGVVAVVRDGGFVGVVAERGEQAIAAIHVLEAEWASPEVATSPSHKLVLSHQGDVDVTVAAGSKRLEARYEVPHISHASIGPSVAVADVRADGADLYVTTQRPFGLRDEIAELLSMPADRVHVHPQVMSGVYGRGNMNDAIVDAVRLSRAVGRPVLVQWTREEEFRLSPHRPALDATISAALDATGAIIAWRGRIRTNYHTYGGTALPPRVLEMTSGRNAVPPYRLGATDVVVDIVPADIRTGAYRSLAAAPNVFAIESAIDELAHVSAQDPIAFRLRHIDDGRLGRVLEAVAERSAFAKRPSGDGRGLGVACAVYHGTYIAQVAEVSVDSSGHVRLEQVWCAVDAGRLVHPDGARNQIEGGIQQAASWTLFEELHVENGRVTTATWSDYPIATSLDAPQDIDVVLIGNPDQPSTGTGEPGSVPTAAAIANAVFAACGVRARRLPLTPTAMAAARR